MSLPTFVFPSQIDQAFSVALAETGLLTQGFLGTASIGSLLNGVLVGSAPVSLPSGVNATPGSAATINNAAGTVVLDHTTGAIFTLTNSLIVAGTHVQAWLETNDATGKGIQSVVLNTSAHTATITLQAAPAANVTIAFVLWTFA